MPATKSLQEIVIAAHFQAPIQLQVLDIAEWVRHFSDFPIVQELPALAPAEIPAAGTQFQLQFVPSQAPMLPRMLLRSMDGRYSVQFQNDRFALGWTRTEPIGDAADYPGFEAFARHWSEALKHFEAWTQARFRQRPVHRLIELTYANATPLESNGKKKRLSEVFKFVYPGTRPVSMFNTSWVERIYAHPPPPETPKGIVTTIVAMGIAPPAMPVLGFNFSGLATVAPGEDSKHILSDIHAKIREIYEGAIIADAD